MVCVMISLPEIESTKPQLTFISSSPVPKDWSLWGIENPNIQCDHGCNTSIPQRDHPVYKFVDSFIEAATSKSVSLTVSLQTLLTTMPQVWKEKTLRNEIVRIFISIATNQMMHEYQYGSLLSQFSTNSLSQIIPFAKAIILIENQDLIQDDDILTIFYHPKITAKYKNFNDDPNASGRRDILKFLSRRISCSCLKDMHRQARLTITKTRRCEYCMEFKERDELMLCGGCRLLEYCSIECQKADWKRDHTKSCAQLADHQHKHQIC